MVGTNVIFVYNDGVVLAKPNWALENSDLKLVMRARIEIEELIHIRHHNIKNQNAEIESELKETPKKQQHSSDEEHQQEESSQDDKISSKLGSKIKL